MEALLTEYTEAGVFRDLEPTEVVEEPAPSAKVQRKLRDDYPLEPPPQSPPQSGYQNVFINPFGEAGHTPPPSYGNRLFGA